MKSPIAAPSRLPFPYRAEAAVVHAALTDLPSAIDWSKVQRAAAPWVQAVRENPPPFWAMETLLKEYPISSAEGLALMRLAEALLRVPDVETAIALTADQLGRADFQGSSDSALARLSSAAIAMSKKFLPEADGTPPSLFERVGARSVVAATLRAVQLLGKQFVLGENIEAAQHEASRARARQINLRFSYDMLGEGARTAADAQRYFDSYQKAIIALTGNADANASPQRNDGISIKLSALHPRYEALNHARVMSELAPKVWQLCVPAAQFGLNLTIDAEEVDRLEISLDVIEYLLARIAKEFPHWSGFGLAMQAYQSRALDLMHAIIALARKYKVRMMCRLVKGAYWDAEIKRAQELGLPHYPVFTHKHHTDISYLACARALLAAPDAIFPQFATHNAGTIAAILQMSENANAPFELQRLHGMGEGIYREVLKNPNVACRVYAPVGQHRDLLAYLVRRLLENGANSSFVNQLADESVGLDHLLQSPLYVDDSAWIALPPHLYGNARRNSDGLDIAVPESRAKLRAAFDATLVAKIADTPVTEIAAMVKRANAAFPAWDHTPVTRRAEMLRNAAAAMQAHLPSLCAVLVKEAHKTWGDAISEVREAIDFLRYYANEAERISAPQVLQGPTGETNTLRLTGRGAWVCVSPWNFPLAIFIGQVAAALATGNTVLAKPAEQTPAIAVAAVKLLHAAGVPADALQLCIGAGETVGAALVSAPQVSGVVFTGSTPVAKIIARALVDKPGAIVPLIAETGGINAMIVDSTALPEQVADAVVQSAFKSAGQRCSALRLLCVHEAIADGVIEMIVGAAQELRVGEAHDLTTDVGPLIDAEAFDGIAKHITRLSAHAKPWLHQNGMNGHKTAPQVFELESIAEVTHEIFGPVLQIVRWRGDPLQVIDEINALGFGLTLGIQTRIDDRAQALAARARVGNVYVNRNMIGAVVGVQPFGGEGLSGTGPKAGGPNYLPRFCAEQTVTINTTAAGGNVSLFV